MPECPTLIDDPAFRSERLVYRAIDSNLDAPLRNRFANIPRVEGFLSGKALIPGSLEETTAYLARSQNLVADPQGNVAGEAIGFVKLSGSAAGIPHRNASFSLSLDPTYQGNGYGTEALNYLCKVGFLYAGLHRIHGAYGELNRAAGRCYEKVGFKVEGLEREAMWYNGGWTNRINIGILEREWRALNHLDAESK